MRQDLLRLLAQHPPFDADEAEHLGRMREWAAGAETPWERACLPAHFTASAVVLTAEGDGVWLVHHAKLDRWLQPGGHLEPGDLGWIAGAQREAEEETGLRVRPAAGGALLDVDVHAIPARRNEPAHLHADGRFLFRALTQAATAQEGEALAVRAFGWDEALAISAEPAFRRLLTKAKRASGTLVP